MHRRWLGALLSAAMVVGLMLTPALAEIVSGQPATEAVQGERELVGETVPSEGEQPETDDSKTDVNADEAAARSDEGQAAAEETVGDKTDKKAEDKTDKKAEVKADKAAAQSDDGQPAADETDDEDVTKSELPSGEWGVCQWEVSTEGVLTVHPGLGKNYDSSYTSPWAGHAEIITSVVFAKEGGRMVIAPEVCTSLLMGLINVTSVDVSGIDMSLVTDAAFMFSGCEALIDLDLSGWDMSNLISLQGMFDGCSSLTSLDVFGWDTAKVTDMDGTFSNCTALTSLDLSDWNTGHVTVTSNMFANCSSLETIYVGGSWSMEGIEDSDMMFDGCGPRVGPAPRGRQARHRRAPRRAAPCRPPLSAVKPRSNH